MQTRGMLSSAGQHANVDGSKPCEMNEKGEPVRNSQGECGTFCQLSTYVCTAS